MPFVKELLKYLHNSTIFVETGTYQGETVDIISTYTNIQNIYSIEYSKVLYENCIKKYKNNKKIKLFHGNSKYDLYDIIKDIQSPITFWLDAHWSGAEHVMNDPNTICPILEELDQIKRHSIKSHVIMVDDIRLMNNLHFPINKKQIIEKILEINPRYEIHFIDDYCDKQDVLVAFIPMELPRCIHRYLTSCESNPMSPGLGDFLRGTIALYQYCKKYNYEFYFDSNSHPFFKFLEDGPFFLKNVDINTTIELIPPLSYKTIDERLDELFSTGESFSTITNSFYRENPTDSYIVNYTILNDHDTKNFMKSWLKPNQQIKSRIAEIYPYTNYKIIHIRTNDYFILNPEYVNLEYINHLCEKIEKILSECESTKYILLTDSNQTGISLCDVFPKLLYWNNHKNHMGILHDPDHIEDTVIDFFIMQNAMEIISIGFSGFSKSAAIIFDIPYRIV